MTAATTRAASRAPPWLSFDIREWSGAFGDLGLLIPIVAALVLSNGFNATSILLVFGAVYILSALYYRLPMPVQPLKAMAAIAIAQGLGADVVSAGALLMAALLLTLAATGLIEPISRLFTKPVVRGIQAAVGLLLIRAALKMSVSGEVLEGRGEMFLSLGVEVPAGVLIALGALGILGITLWKRGLPTALIVLAFGLSVGLALGSAGAVPLALPGPEMPAPSLPDGAALSTAFVLLVIPQLPLTIGNAVVACNYTAHGYYGERASRVSHRSLLSTMGIANLFAGAAGAMPVCHGAGGLTAHYRFGARTAGAGLIIGALLVLLALGFGSAAIDLFGLIPYPVLGVMLGVVGAQHALLARDCRRLDEISVVVTVALLAFALGNVAIGFAAGIALHLAIATGRWAFERTGLRRDQRPSPAEGPSPEVMKS